MEDVCERMMDIARRGEKELLSQKVIRNLSQRLHDDEFWSEAVVVSWDDVAEKVVEKRSLSLKQLIECAYALCNAVIDDYESLSHRVVDHKIMYCEWCGLHGRSPLRDGLWD